MKKKLLAGRSYSFMAGASALMVLLLFGNVLNALAAERTAVTGNWSTTAASNTAWGGTVTTSADTLIIPNGVTVTVSTATCTGGALVVEQGGTLTFASSSSRNVNIVSGAGYAGTVTINGTVAMANSNGQFIAYNGPTFTLGAASAWTWAGTSSGADGGIHYTGTVGSTIFGNGKTCGSLTVTAAAATVTIAGDLTIKGQGTTYGAVLLQNATNNLNINVGSTLTLAPNGATTVPWIITSGAKVAVNGTVDDRSGAAGTIAGTGAITISNNARYIHNHAGTTIIGATANTVTWNTGSTLEIKGITGTTPTAASLSQTFYNLVWNCAAQSANITLAQTNTMAVLGTFTVSNTNAAAAATRSVRLNANSPVTYTLSVGSLVLNGGNLSLSSGSSAVTLASAGDVTLSNNSILDLSQGGTGNSALTVAGDLVAATGTTITETGSGTGNAIVFNKVGTQNFTTNLATLANDVSYTINSGSVLNLVGKLKVNTGGTLLINTGGSLNVSSSSSLAIDGIATLNDSPVRFLSDVNGTATLAQSNGTFTGATNVSVERYVPAKRAWRLMNAPFSTGNTINAAWQNGQVYTPGVGTFVTGSGAGFDAGNSSLKTYNTTTQALENLPSTNVDIAAQPAYFVFVRGDRNPNNLTIPNSNTTTLGATGTLKTGAQSATVVKMPAPATPAFTAVGNPYVSPIDWALVTKTNTADRFYVWDPKLSGSNGVGGFVVFDNATGYLPSVGGGSYAAGVANTVIESSQAFFVESNTDAADGSLGFAEGNKVASNQNVFRTGNGTVEKLNIVLKVQQADNSFSPADGVFGLYENAFSTAVTSEDASKLDNFSENLSIVRNGRRLAIEKRPLIDANDTLFLQLQNTTARNYQFAINASSFNAPLLSAFVEDSYTGTSTPVSLNGNTTVSFAVTADPASANANRFSVVFRTSGTLPVNYTSVKAYQQRAGVQVDWKVATESNVRSYEVERSADGRSFAKAGTVTASANNNAAVSYGWLDASPVIGTNYYRVKAIDNNGAAKYSQVVNVKIGGKSEISVYPNPVVGNTLSLQFANEAKGTYTLTLFNNLGQVVFTKTLEHAGGSASQTVSLNNAVGKGVYQLQVSNGTVTMNQQVVIK